MKITIKDNRKNTILITSSESFRQDFEKHGKIEYNQGFVVEYGDIQYSNHGTIMYRSNVLVPSTLSINDRLVRSEYIINGGYYQDAREELIECIAEDFETTKDTLDIEEYRKNVERMIEAQDDPTR